MLIPVLGCVSADMGTEPEPQPLKPIYSYEVEGEARSAEGRSIKFYVDRPKNLRVPILLIIDGSGCGGQLREGFAELFRPNGNSSTPFARLAVEKPGVEAFDNQSNQCSNEFLKHYSIQDRVLDHLRVLQHLRRNAPWWNGQLYVFGWSDGGDIAAQLTSYYPSVTRALLGAMGGGYTMAEHFTQFWVCTEDMPSAERQSCQRSLNEQFETMRDNPTWKKTWSGQDNTWKAWASRLDTRLSHLLEDNDTPILIVHGAEDFEAAPVESARKLVGDLQSVRNERFSYWEIPNMGHTWSPLPPEEVSDLERKMLQWLLSGDDDPV